jgi:hypothetical protein
VDIGSKQVAEGLVLVARNGLWVYCLHKRCFVLTVITPLQKRAESERKREISFFRRSFSSGLIVA